MTEILADYYVRLVATHALLGGRLMACPIVDLMRWTWAALFTIQILRLTAQALLTRKLMARATPFGGAANGELLAQYKKLAARVGLRRLPPLLQSPFLRYPAFTIGIVRPVVFLHPILITTLDRQELASAITHELVHVKRRDNLSLWCLDLLVTGIPLLAVLLFGLDFSCGPNQLIGILVGTLATVGLTRQLLVRSFRTLRENSCDDRTVAITQGPLALASALIKTWRLTHNQPTSSYHLAWSSLLLANGPCVEDRVRRLTTYRRPWLLPLLSRGFKFAFASVLLAYGFFLWQYHIDKSYQGVVATCNTTQCAAITPRCHP